MKNDDKRKKKFSFKKIHRRVIALFLAVLSVLSVGIQAAAAFVAAGAIEGLVTICVTIATACGLMSHSEAQSMAINAPRDLLSEVYRYNIENAADPVKNVGAVLSAAGKIIEVTDGLQKLVNENYGKSQTKEDKNFSGVSFASDFSNFIQSSQSHVKQVADSSVDMQGYGALVHINYPSSVSGKASLIYCDYVVVSSKNKSEINSFTIHAENSYKIIWANGAVSDYPHSVSQTYPVDQQIHSYGISFFGDIRYIDGTKADDVVTSETKPASIGEVTDTDGKPLTDAEGNTYVVNADGTVTVNGEDIPINEDGTVTINGDTYNVTYNLSAYDDTAIIDLLQRILGKLDNTYITDDGTLTEDVPTAVPETITGEGLINAADNAINFIPYDGLGSVQAVLETTTFTDKAPQDIVLNLDTVFYKGTWVLIPASIITEWAEAINVIKLFVSTVLLWVFIMWVRRLLFKNLFT